MDVSNFPPIGALLVSKMIMEEGAKPGFLYREKRADEEDSGWRIFSGLESDEYAQENDNFGLYAVSDVLAIDPSLAALLLKGVGSVYERDEQDEWVKIVDFEMEDNYIETHALTATWQIDINHLFERRVEEGGDLLYTTGDKSLRLTIWKDDSKSRQQLYDETLQSIAHREQDEAPTLESFEFSDENGAKTGYMILESDGVTEYHVIYGFNIADGEVLMSVFYFDEAADREWALQTWQGIRAVKG
ncbi:DUF2185 domain-containing protein [Chitinophaga pollutisoli]|uniref:DUF2185 domain-containing protein n=1 Tax=Chitinophaga pollutisoli TaxID=3133966 RepID=A0ABZ2YJI4_9BACT